MNRLDRSEQGVAAGVGRARIIGKLRSVAIYLKNVEFASAFLRRRDAVHTGSL